MGLKMEREGQSVGKDVRPNGYWDAVWQQGWRDMGRAMQEWRGLEDEAEAICGSPH